MVQDSDTELLAAARFDGINANGKMIRPDQAERDYTDLWRLAACCKSKLCSVCDKHPSHVNAIVIAVDGACRNNGTAEARAAIGVFVGKKSPHNVSERLKDGRQTNQRAELSAALRALEGLDEIYFDRESFDNVQLSEVVIKTDSAYLVNGMTQWIKKWEVNGYQTFNHQEVTNADLFKLLKTHVQIWAARNVRVVFWHVGREFNAEADLLANLALDRASYGAMN